MEQFRGCWMTYPTCKEDCYWYEEWQDMVAHVPYCRCKKTEFIEPKDCENCEQYHSKYKPTNADKIRAMTDEELADLLHHWWLGDTDYFKTYCLECKEKYPCHDDCLLDWLKSEVK